MISEEELKEIMSNEGINCFSVTGSKSSFEKSILILEENDMNEFLRFVKTNNIKNVFYAHSFYDEDYFLITEELIEKFDEGIKKIIEKDIEEHNEKIEELDFFENPLTITIFCIYESRYIGINDFDEWCDELSNKEKLMDLVNGNSDKIDKIKKNRKISDETLKEEFKIYVLKDDEFKKCTNQRLRRDYMYSVLEREDAKKYKPLFLSAYGTLDVTAFNFIEMLWREYKS